MSSITGYTKQKIDSMLTGVPTVWAPNTVYAAGVPAVSPNGDVITRITSGTSTATYAADAANWALSATYALVTSVAPVTLDGGNATSVYTGTFNFDGGTA